MRISNALNLLKHGGTYFIVNYFHALTVLIELGKNFPAPAPEPAEVEFGQL